METSRERPLASRTVVFGVGDDVLEGRRQRAVHNVPDRVAKRRVLDSLFQKVEHRLEEGGPLRQTRHPSHRLPGVRYRGSWNGHKKTQ